MKIALTLFGVVLAGLHSSVASAAVYAFNFSDADFGVAAQITTDAVE
jgi:hypothetical protein